MEAIEIKIQADGAIDQLAKLEKSTEQAAQSAVSLKSQLRQMQTELSTLDPNTEAFQELSKKTGEIKDKINDAAEATRANAGPAFESLGNNFGLLTQRIGNLDFEGVGQSLKGMAGSIKGLSFKEITAGIGGMTSGLATLGKAILSNPILLLASVIIGIAMNFDKLLAIFPSLNEALTGVSEEMNASLEVSKQLVEQDKARLQYLNEHDALLKEQGLTEREILKLKEAASIKQMEDLKSQILAQQQIAISQVETSKRNRDILKGILEFITFPIQAMLGSVDMLTEKLHAFGAISDETFATVGNLRDRFNTSIAEMVFDPNEVQAEATKTLSELDKQYHLLDNQRAGYHLSIQAADKAAADKRVADAKALNERLAKEDEAELERRKKLQGEFDAITSKGVGDILSNEQLKTGIVISESQKRLTAEREAAQKKAEEDKIYDEIDRQRMAQRFQLASGTIDALSALNESFTAKSSKDAKRQFQISKALSLSSAIVKGIESGVSAFAKGSEIGGPPLGIAYAAISAAVSLAQINKIRQSQYSESGGGSSVAASTSATPITSNTQQPNNNAFNSFNPAALNNRPSQVTPQAYVLAGGVSSSLEAEQKIRDRARL